MKKYLAYHLNIMCTILAAALPIGSATLIGLIAVLISYHILSASNAHNLYWLALYTPINYYLIALYESLRATSIFIAIKIGWQNNAQKLMMALFIIAGIIVLGSGSLFYLVCMLFHLLHQAVQFYYFCVAMIFSALFVCGFYIITSFYYGLQRKQFSVILSLCAAILQCGLMYILVKKLQWGISSYALSNMLGYGIVAWLAWWIFSIPRGFSFNPFCISRVDLYQALKLLRFIGLPVWTVYFIIFISLGLINHLLVHFGPLIVSAYGLVFRIQSIILFPAIALGTALSILVNQCHRKHQFHLAQALLKEGLLLCVLLYSVLGMLCFSYKIFLMQCVTQHKEIVYAGAEYLKYCALSYSALGPIIMYGVFLEQTGFGLRNLCIQGVYFFVLISVGWYLTKVLRNYHYFYCFIAIENFIGFLLLSVLFFMYSDQQSCRCAMRVVRNNTLHLCRAPGISANL